jgi:hypothetical protein
MRGDQMNILVIIAWSMVAATVAWGLTLRRTAAAIAMLRADTAREIRYWQDQTARARTRTAQLERELASWAEGCRQGREDVASIMPMLLKAHAQPTCVCQAAAGGRQ